MKEKAIIIILMFVLCTLILSYCQDTDKENLGLYELQAIEAIAQADIEQAKVDQLKAEADQLQAIVERHRVFWEGTTKFFTSMTVNTLAIVGYFFPVCVLLYIVYYQNQRYKRMMTDKKIRDFDLFDL